MASKSTTETTRTCDRCGLSETYTEYPKNDQWGGILVERRGGLKIIGERVTVQGQMGATNNQPGNSFMMEQVHTKDLCPACMAAVILWFNSPA